MKKKYLIIIILSLVAIVNATYLSQKAYYYKVLNVSQGSSFCDINETVACSLVLQSPYSQVFGVPFPWIALGVYPVILIIALWGFRKSAVLPAKILMGLSAAGMMFNFFIMYREIVFIKAFCLLCFICTLIIISIFSISSSIFLKEKSSNNAII